MKILLINPPSRKPGYETIVVPPLGLLYIGTELRRAGFNVVIKDAFAERMGWQELEHYVARESPAVACFGGMSPVIDTVFRAIRIARPHVKHVVMGGPHMSLYREEVFKQCADIDYGVAGEGEIAAVELMKALREERSPDGISGVIGRGLSNPGRGLIPDIDKIPIPDRSMLVNQLYHYPLLKYRRVTTMFTSRGCPYNCSFCDKTIFGSVWRPRSAESVLKEIDDVVERFHIRSIIFYDDLFTVNKERVIAICEGILRKGYKLDWKCEGRVNLVDVESLRLMKKAGCSTIAYGVESGNQHGLDYLNKRTTPDQIRNAFAVTKQVGLKTMGYFILGIPVETYDDAGRTIDLACKLNPTYAQFSVLSPFYGTKVYDDAVNNGWYAEVDAGNPVDQDLKRAVILSPNWTVETLRKVLREAHVRFYFRPGYLAGLMMSAGGLRQLLAYARGFFKLIFWMHR